MIRRVGLTLLIVGLLPWVGLGALIARGKTRLPVAADYLHQGAIHGATTVSILMASLPLAPFVAAAGAAMMFVKPRVVDTTLVPKADGS
jgi:hypothetical protein